MKRLDQLTFTRFLALLLVLFYHGFGGIYRAAIDVFPLSSIFRAAPSVVSYLYVLSGFVMSLVYHRPNERFNVRAYWTARFVRIYPLYIIAFLLVCVYYAEYMPRISALKILANLFVLQGWIPSFAQSFNYPSWSLTVEFFFYALFPFITMWTYRQPMRRLIWVSLALWVVSQVVHYFLWLKFFPAAEFILVYQPIFHLNSFLLGLVAGIWYVRESPRQELRPRVTLPLLAAGALLVTLFAIAGDLVPRFPRDLQPMEGLFSPVFAMLILTLGCDKSQLSTFLNRPWPVLLGETAYALYILQVPVSWFYKRALSSAAIDGQGQIRAATLLPLMLLVGLVAHLYVDLPLRRWLKGVMARVSAPLVLLDLLAVAASISLSFLIRFGSGKELREFAQTAYLMFWLAFLIRIAFPLFFGTSGRAILHLPFRNAARLIVLSVSAGSLLLAALMWIASALSWIPGYPRSIILMDWAFMSMFSVLIRRGFQAAAMRAQSAATP